MWDIHAVSDRVLLLERILTIVKNSMLIGGHLARFIVTIMYKLVGLEEGYKILLFNIISDES